MEARNLQAGQIVDIYSHFEGELRKAARFAIVPYGIARRSAAAYYPETNVLIPIRSVAAKSNQPASKCIRITLTPADPGEALQLTNGRSCSQPGSRCAARSLTCLFHGAFADVRGSAGAVPRLDATTTPERLPPEGYAP